jgi:ubiquinone/menaquinone biosynthesis C-methylase UbiE
VGSVRRVRHPLATLADEHDLSELPLSADFSAVTEIPGARATREQLAMIQTRYAEAARLAEGRRVLEVACGPGRGLGLIAGRARLTVGTDLTHGLIRQARDHYGDRLPVLQSDAHSLPFVDNSFELAIMFEAIYYLADPEQFIEECRRILVPGGTLLLSTANREWAGFTSSAMATRYLSASELYSLLARHGFSPRVLGAFPAAEPRASARNLLVSSVRRTALACGLVPATLHGREFLKRLFYGPLTALGPEIGDTDTDPVTPELIGVPSAVTKYKVLFAVGQLAGPH